MVHKPNHLDAVGASNHGIDQKLGGSARGLTRFSSLHLDRGQSFSMSMDRGAGGNHSDYSFGGYSGSGELLRHVHGVDERPGSRRGI